MGHEQFRRDPRNDERLPLRIKTLRALRSRQAGERLVQRLLLDAIGSDLARDGEQSHSLLHQAPRPLHRRRHRPEPHGPLLHRRPLLPGHPRHELRKIVPISGVLNVVITPTRCNPAPNPPSRSRGPASSPSISRRAPRPPRGPRRWYSRGFRCMVELPAGDEHPAARLIAGNGAVREELEETDGAD